MNELNITILKGRDGGLIVYENIDGESVLIFGGNLEEASKYLSTRMGSIIDTPTPKIAKITVDDLLKDVAA